MLLVDGVKYNLWIPETEEQLESMIKEHAKEIFGNDSLYFGIKQKIVSRTGIGSIPDGYLIKFEPLEWYLVEAELSSHTHEHVVMQLNRFMSGIRNFESQREITEAIYSEIARNSIMRETIKINSKSDDVHHFLTNLISQIPKIMIIVEQEDPDIQEACENLRIVPEIVVFKTYVKERADLKAHIHQIEPLGFVPSIVPSKYTATGIRVKTTMPKRKLPPQYENWETMLAWVNDKTKDIVKELSNRIGQLGEVNQKPLGRYYAFYRGERHSASRFVALILKKDKISVRIRVDPTTLRDPQRLVKEHVYAKWFFHHGQGHEREFEITDKEQIDYVMGLIKQSYSLVGK